MLRGDLTLIPYAMTRSRHLFFLFVFTCEAVETWAPGRCVVAVTYFLVNTS